MQGQTESSPVKRTHLWIHIVQQSMAFCNLDSLLSLDASLSCLIHKRGIKATLQVIFDKLLLNPKSVYLARSVALSLCLATIQAAPKTGLADEVVVQFARLSMLPGNGVKSAIETLRLTLSLLMSSISTSRDARRIQQLTDAVQAIVSLHVTKQLRKVKRKIEVDFIVRLYGTLFQNMPSSSILVHALSTPVHV